MAAMTSKFNTGCVIQYYSDQCIDTDKEKKLLHAKKVASGKLA